MKQILYTVIFLGISLSAFAQNDTLLHEDFSTIFDAVAADFGGSDGVSTSPTSSPTVWVNFDEDGLFVGGNAPSQKWFWDSLDFFGNNLGVLKSQSWLMNNAPDNRNWLILPRLEIVDANAVLSWSSAPYQGPRYMDGYTVLVSITDRDLSASVNPFMDTLFTAAEMVSINNGNNSLMVSDYTFSDGYIHADSYTDSMYFLHPGEDTLNFTDAENFNLGQLEPHSVDLSAYVGRSIYIAFLHNSSDDNQIELDNILVKGTTPVISTKKISEELGLEIFPNPTRDYINLSYEVIENTEISAQIYDMQGRLMQVYNNLSSTAGEHQHRINVSDLASGNYNIVITSEGQRLSKSFIKQ